MSIVNPTLAHFRHFSSLFTNLPAYKALYLRAYKAAFIYVPIRHYICREPSTNQLLFMQNKPNFQKSQMNANSCATKNYENISDWTLGENKPNSKPIKPNFRKAQMNVNLTLTKGYRKKDDFALRINKPNSNPISKMAKMNVNLYVIEDYKNEPPSGSKKTNPNKPKQTQFPLPLSSAFCLLSSVLYVFSVASLLFLIMDCKIVNIEDTPFVRRIQLPAASARANVTAQPAAIITIRAKMMYLTLTSRKKRSKKRKYTPKTDITKAKNAITTSTQHNNAQAGWI